MEIKQEPSFVQQKRADSPPTTFPGVQQSYCVFEAG